MQRAGILLWALALVALAGCMDTTSAPPPMLSPPVPASVQSQARDVVQGFVGDLDRRDFHSAELLLTPALRAQMPPATLAANSTRSYRPFAGASDWGFDQYQYLMRGQQVVARAHFTGADRIVYRTNFVLAQSPAGWQVAMILAPIKPQTQHLIVKNKG